MESFTFQGLLAWVSQHSPWAAPLVFFIAFSESLVVLGLVMPGAMLLFGAGALVGAGAIPLWPVMIAAALGAMAGDGLSYWLGRHYKAELRTVWPFRAYPTLVTRGVEFFHRHGGKSVAMARFVGPLRAIVPAVAGMLEMPVRRYVAINVLASVAWSPAYLLPGVAFGTSLQLASEVAGRLVIFLLLMLAVLWFTAWLLSRTWRLLAPHTYRFIQRVLLWARGHPFLGALPTTLLDPEHPEARGLSLLALFLLLSALLFLFVTQAVLGEPLPTNLDLLIFHGLQQLRTPWTDGVMVFAAGLGDSLVLGIVTATMGGWLTWKRDWRTLAHWLAAVLVALLMVTLLQLAAHTMRPPVSTALAHADAFPSSHATVSMAVYGFLAVMLAAEWPYRLHLVAYIAAGLAVTAIGLGHLYLGSAWLSELLGGLSLGLAWTALLGIAYRTHVTHATKNRLQFSAAALLALVLGLAGNASLLYPANRLAHAPQETARLLAAGDWWREGWMQLPAYRSDLWGQQVHRLTLQWAGSESRIADSLLEMGWRRPGWQGTRLLYWLNSEAPAIELPLMPQVHQGRHEALRLARPDASDPERVQVLRLWPSNTSLDGGDEHQPVWLGSITYLRKMRILGLSVLRTELREAVPGEQIARHLDPRVWQAREAIRPTESSMPVVLIQAAR